MVGITVEKQRGRVDVICWGCAPFVEVLDRNRGSVVIPSGFKVHSYSDGVVWTAETLVSDGKVWYRFIPRNLYHKVADTWQAGYWQKATKAYKAAQVWFFNNKVKRHWNGALVIGCSYPNLQAEIRRRHNILSDQLVPARRHAISSSPSSSSEGERIEDSQEEDTSSSQSSNNTESEVLSIFNTELSDLFDNTAAPL